MGWPVLNEEQQKVYGKAQEVNAKISGILRTSVAALLTHRVELAQLHAERDALCDAADVCRECYGVGASFATDGCPWCELTD